MIMKRGSGVQAQWIVLVSEGPWCTGAYSRDQYISLELEVVKKE